MPKNEVFFRKPVPIVAFMSPLLKQIHIFIHYFVHKYYGNTGCGVFKREGTKLERFLPKNQHTQRKLLNWISGGLRHFQKSEV